MPFALTNQTLSAICDCPPEDILYVQLVSKISASDLTPGRFYRITDYATTHYIVDADDTQYITGDGIIVGPTEPLIVLAVAADEISTQAWSQTYPQDEIWYDWNPANWLGDYSFADQGGPTIIPNFKGVITYRRDTQYDNYAPGDWRHCMTRRWQTNADAWAVGTNYSAGDIVFHNNGGDFVYKALVDNIGQEPAGSDDGYWIIMLDLGTYTYWNASPASWQGVTSAATYDDFALFAAGQPLAVHIEQVAASGNTGITLLPRSVFWDGDSTYQDSIEAGFSVNTIGAYFGGNTIGANFTNNTIGANFRYNTTGASFGGNTIGANFRYNTIGADFTNNTIGADFTNNTIGANFRYNTTGAEFGVNTIGANFRYNTIGANFSVNTIGAGFQMNTVADNCVTTVDLSGATHVYNAYTCYLYTDSVLGLRLRYVANDVDTFVAATA